MKYSFSTEYAKEEMQFMEQHHCEILSEIKLSRTNFTEYEIPRRMFIYYGTYVGEIIDDETGEFVWAVLSYGKSKCYHWTAYYSSLKSLEYGL